ncbi:Anaphase-promoting complex subunit 10 [Stylosanthes scabra]|uniref:Anaphase-promoting complex subunit 10 n=1 Tax=Stylosanthes scabra TaxID=79078 RepID=A0ABU6QJ76_9FABA|nr:Anaphase-promoting complex subunit 10 [Stylosanthes scabra]
MVLKIESKSNYMVKSLDRGSVLGSLKSASSSRYSPPKATRNPSLLRTQNLQTTTVCPRRVVAVLSLTSCLRTNHHRSLFLTLLSLPVQPPSSPSLPPRFRRPFSSQVGASVLVACFNELSFIMAADSSEGEEEVKLTGGNQLLVVDADLREMGKKAAWSVSSCKPGNGVSCLRDDNLETYWQSDGAQPHLVNIQFQKKVRLQLIILYVDFKLDESYTPSKVSIRAGDGFHNLKEIKTVEFVKPAGWVYLSLSGTDPRETFVNTFMLQIAVLSNHLNGRDTHVRQIKVYGPRPCVSLYT